MSLFLLKRFLLGGHVEFRFRVLRPQVPAALLQAFHHKGKARLVVVCRTSATPRCRWVLVVEPWKMGKTFTPEALRKLNMSGWLENSLGFKKNLSSYVYLNTGNNFLPSWELTCQHFFKMIILFPRWDMSYFFGGYLTYTTKNNQDVDGYSVEFLLILEPWPIQICHSCDWYFSNWRKWSFMKYARRQM